MSKKTTLVVMAAGLGSRFGGNKQISKVGPNGEILMQYSIHDALEAGFDKIVFILKAEMIETVKKLVGDKISTKVEVCYAVQDFSSIPSFYEIPKERTKPFGTLHAVLCAKDFVNEPFATINADDYYGREGFQIMHDLLLSLKDKGEAVMVPYVLKNTMSKNGGVTRGVCSIEKENLTSCLETGNIHYAEDGKIASDNGFLEAETPVSMNFWGFSSTIFNEMEDYFEAFLKGLTPEQIKKECLLPAFVGDLLGEKKLVVKAIPSHDRWFGITYKEDREEVMQELKALHEQKIYPEKL